MPYPNDTHPPRNNSFRCFSAAEACQYVNYCLRLIRKKIIRKSLVLRCEQFCSSRTGSASSGSGIPVPNDTHSPRDSSFRCLSRAKLACRQTIARAHSAAPFPSEKREGRPLSGKRPCFLAALAVYGEMISPPARIVKQTFDFFRAVCYIFPVGKERAEAVVSACDTEGRRLFSEVIWTATFPRFRKDMRAKG